MIAGDDQAKGLRGRTNRCRRAIVCLIQAETACHITGLAGVVLLIQN